jgi:transcriptional regulator with XRE-family HTH domain
VDAIEAALLRGDADYFTRRIPARPLTQMKELLKAEKGNTKAVADRLGISRRQVERYLAGKAKTPRRELSAALVREVTKVWQPRIKQQARKRAAASGGITVETRARFGYTAPVGTTDDPRERRLTVHLPPAYAQRLFDAQQQGLGDQALRDIVAEGLQEVYFKDGGTRAGGLEVEMTDVRYFDVSF